MGEWCIYTGDPGSMRMINLGCTNEDLKHVLSFRRQVFMFLNSASQTLDASFRVRHGERTFVVFASTDSLRCFECGDIGHMKRTCPHKDKDRTGDEGTVPGGNSERKDQ